MIRHKKYLLFACSILLFFNSVLGQDYKFHKIFIYNFAKYIQWPASFGDGEIVIGILGESPIENELKKGLSDRKIGNQGFRIVRFASQKDIGKCHMVFIPFNRSGELEDIRKILDDTSAIIITEKPGLGKQGSSINFVLQGGTWTFEINRKALESKGLKVSGELTKLAKIIE